jgi:hypothetical protein
VSLKEIFKGRIKTREQGKEILKYEVYIIDHHLEIEIFNVIMADLMVFIISLLKINAE